MPRPKGIPPDLESAVLVEAGKGRTTRQIAEWLEREHGIRVSHVTVAKHLRETRNERADVAKAVVRKRLQKELPADLDALAEIRARLEGYELQAAEAGDLDVAIRAAKAQRETIETTLRFSGAGEPDAAPEAGLAAIIVLPAPTED